MSPAGKPLQIPDAKYICAVAVKSHKTPSQPILKAIYQGCTLRKLLTDHRRHQESAFDVLGQALGSEYD